MKRKREEYKQNIKPIGSNNHMIDCILYDAITEDNPERVDYILENGREFINLNAKFKGLTLRDHLHGFKKNFADDEERDDSTEILQQEEQDGGDTEIVGLDGSED